MRQFALILALLVTGFCAGTAAAQNLVITNARIIVGDGQVIEKGAVVVKDGKIDSSFGARLLRCAQWQYADQRRRHDGDGGLH